MPENLRHSGVLIELLRIINILFGNYYQQKNQRLIILFN